jgi:hypothetical protein
MELACNLYSFTSASRAAISPLIAAGLVSNEKMGEMDPSTMILLK